METAVSKSEPTTAQDVMKFMKALSRQDADSIEKVLLHLLDSARARWNKRAQKYLLQLKDPAVPAEVLQEVQQKYDHATRQHRVLTRMRHGVGVVKRTF